MLTNIEFTVIIDHSVLLYVLNTKRELPTLRFKEHIKVLRQYDLSEIPER